MQLLGWSAYNQLDAFLLWEMVIAGVNDPAIERLSHRTMYKGAPLELNEVMKGNMKKTSKST